MGQGQRRRIRDWGPMINQIMSGLNKLPIEKDRQVELIATRGGEAMTGRRSGDRYVGRRSRGSVCRGPEVRALVHVCK